MLPTLSHIPRAAKNDVAMAPAGQPYMPEAWPDFSKLKVDPDIVEKFFNRKEEYDMIMDHLKRQPTVSLLLLGPMHCGKSVRHAN